MALSVSSDRLRAIGSLWVLIRVALAVLLVATVTRAGADPDLWGHVRFGQDILAAGAVVKADPYSFTSDREWVNHEWLAEVAMALAWNAGGTAGLVALKALLLLATLALVGWAARREGVPSLAVWLLVVLAAVGVVPRATTVRPQLFSLLLFAAQLVILTEHERRGRRALLLGLPPLYALWVNLHGGWLVGGAVLALWTAGLALERRGPLPDHLWRGVAGLLALLATLINPYGLGMWRFLADTVGFERAHIADWQPVSTSVALLVPWAVVAAACVTALVASWRMVSRVHLLVLFLLGVAAVRVSRLDAFFALAVATVLAPQLSRVFAGLQERLPSQRVPPDQVVGRALITGVVAAALLVSGARFVRANASCLEFGDPATAPEPEAVSFIQANGIRGRVLTYYNYGEYAIWHLAPDIKVSMDGRRETVYSDAVVDAHTRFYADPVAQATYPGSIGAEFVWLPNVFWGDPALGRHGWRRVFEGPVSAIWARRQPGPTLRVPRGPRDAPRCFPNR